MIHRIGSTRSQTLLWGTDPTLEPELDLLIGEGDIEVLTSGEPRDVVTMAVAMREFAGRRSATETLIAVSEPADEDGWTSYRSVVQVCAPDSPFLVDSIVGSIARRGLSVYLVAHPVVAVHRDTQGRLLKFGACEGDSEAWIRVEIERIPTPEGRQELESLLGTVLADARLAGSNARPQSIWDGELAHALQRVQDAERATTLLNRYASALPEGYKENVPPREAVADIALLEKLSSGTTFAVHLHAPEENKGGERLFTFASSREHPLTRILPLLTDLGIDVADEHPYAITLPDGTTRYISDFGLKAPAVSSWNDRHWGADFEEAFEAAWSGASESDRLNSLVMLGRLDWRSIVILRAVSTYLRQAGSTFSLEYLHQALVENPEIASGLVKLFEARFDPTLPGDRAAEATRLRTGLVSALDGVSSLDHDRILRSFIAVIQATLRTNYYQRTREGSFKHWVSMKFDCSRVPGLPTPCPMAEIFVYSPQVEGVHLRFGKIARGGIRWSDRREDFRTEVLGLVKAQIVKNVVIVPTGSKGGFFAKQLPPPNRTTARIQAGEAAYCTFIRGLLDITDNRDGGAVVPPQDVVRYDGNDPYLVIAADKGTASFSDAANSISKEYGYWLDDAFASGGSAGYDHKAMGITARGAWESVRRHFRELGLDTQSEDFSVAGIGDMSGDVFGNGMLRSQHIRLIAAFDHRHVFLDPNPDAAATFAERKRLFELPGSSWDDFDRSLLSTGGGVFPLSAKSIKLTPQAIRSLGIAHSGGEITPLELKRAILLAPVDLLWNGAIGTYVKASGETNSEVGDRGNDPVRINGNELLAHVVGEGGNLGISQRGRIEAALAGVHINTDAIDNSAGVDTSDHEVNIKILLGILEREGRLDRETRDGLLRRTTAEVAEQVLRDNYEQNVLLGNSRATAVEMLAVHERLIEWLEARGELDRKAEFLPTHSEVARRITEGRGLMRPEYAVLVAHVKLALKTDLAAADFADDTWFERTLAEYFPGPIRDLHADAMAAHPLRREIVINSVVNSMVNHVGITFVHRVTDETHASSDHMARAYVIAREVFGLADFTREVEAMDNALPTAAQTELYLAFRHLLARATRWFVPRNANIGSDIEAFSEAVRHLTAHLEMLLRGKDRERHEEQTRNFLAAGVPESLARHGAALAGLFQFPFLDIVECSRSRGWSVDDVASVYFVLYSRLRFGEFLSRVTKLSKNDRWGAMARSAMRDDLYSVLIELTESVLRNTSPAEPDERVDVWYGRCATADQQLLDEVLDATESDDEHGLAPLSVALRRLRSLMR